MTIRDTPPERKNMTHATKLMLAVFGVRQTTADRHQLACS
jgi:hypothetical protein